MNKQRVCLTLLVAAGLCCVAAPSQAILGESSDLVRTYFNGPKGKPTRALEKLPLMTSFATIRRESKPQSLFLYPDDKGLIQRELWIAPPQGMWKPEQADKIRNAIMSGRSLKGSLPFGMMGRQYLYSDGSWVSYRTSKGLVYSIFAVDKSFQPGNMGQLPKGMKEPEKKIIRPRSQ